MPSVVVGVDGSQASILALRWAGVIAHGTELPGALMPAVAAAPVQPANKETRRE